MHFCQFWNHKLLKRVIDRKRDVAVLDIGTNKVCFAIAKSDQKSMETSAIERETDSRVLGVGYQLAKGIKRGAITNLEELEDSILNAITTAEKEAQKSVRSVFVALPSWAIESQGVENSINIGQVPIDDIHVNSLIDFDTTKYVDEAMEVIHVFPVSFSVDDAKGIQDPIGMLGEKLSAVVHIMSAPASFVKNIKNCLNRNNIEVEGFIASTYASGLSVILDEEISSGVTLIDIGGSTTSIACFCEGTLLYLGAIPIGSQNITNDISMILRTSRSQAERLKILYGVTPGGSTTDEEQILIPRVDEYGEEHIQNISKSMLDSIIRARLEEILDLAQNHINGCGADSAIYQRIVITGGGSRISGLNELVKAKRYFSGSSIRLGKPIGTIGSHDFVQTASFASAAGVILYSFGDFLNNTSMKLLHSKKTFWQKIITWFKRGV